MDKINQEYIEPYFAPLDSPTFTGTPTAPTAPAGTNTTQIATMEAVQTAIANNVDISSPQTITGDKAFDGRLYAGNLEVGGNGIEFTSGNYVLNVDRIALSGSRNIKFPDASGTVALVETIRPYKVYTALLSQSGTNAPTATVLENTLGVTISFSYVAAGVYAVSASSSVFTSNKTSVQIGSGGSGTSIYTHTSLVAGSFDIQVRNSSSLSLANSGLNTNLFEIRVYN